MNFQQLKYVRAAVRNDLNLTEVANALYTSQSGVSKQIRELEAELGIEIFVRQAHGARVHEAFNVTLYEARIAAVQVQADLLRRHRLIEKAVDVASWIDPAPVRLAQATVAL